MKTKFTSLVTGLGCMAFLSTGFAQTLIKEIRPSGGSNPAFLTNLNGTILFAANDGTNGSELWKTDGTTAGTSMAKNMNPTGNSFFSEFKISNSKIFFSGATSFGANELWVTDGTNAGTFEVKDINAGSSGSNPDYITDLNGVIYFRANDGINGKELWKSDGTSAGTVLVKDITPGTSGNGPQDITNVNGTLFFRIGNDLWKSDGTTAGTTSITALVAGTEFKALGPILIFQGSDGELWKSDGTAAGTVLIMDINPGSSTSSPIYFTAMNGFLYFTAVNSSGSATGSELWRTDGTTAGTTLVKDINPGAGNSTPTQLIGVNNTLYFYATDGANGNELWKSDGTAAGTSMVKDINPGAGSAISSPGINDHFTAIGNTLYFKATDGVNGYELWSSDGTAAGTSMLGNINPTGDSNPQWMTNLNGTLVFSASNADLNGNAELWKAGTTTGITRYSLNKGLNVYPNPTTGKIKITVSEFDVNGTEFTIFSSLGNVVAQFRITAKDEEYDLSELSKGIYYIRGGGHNFKLVKE